MFDRSAMCAVVFVFFLRNVEFLFKEEHRNKTSSLEAS